LPRASSNGPNNGCRRAIIRVHVPGVTPADARLQIAALGAEGNGPGAARGI
jgi:hypothetical protein